MNLRRNIRVSIALVAVLAAAALSAGSASAAGVPQIAFSSAGTYTLNEYTATPEINPNGAETTVKLEYGPKSVTEFSTKPISIGSGTSYVKVSAPIRGLHPHSEFVYRINATNSYGTKQTEAFGRETGYFASTKVKWPATYSASGNLKIFISGFNATISCTETGEGKLYSWLAEPLDSYTIDPGTCVVEGQPACKIANPVPITLQDTFWAGSPFLLLEMGESCTLPSIQLNAQEAFKVDIPKTHASTQPVTLTMNTTWGLHNVTVTNSSNWKLTGVNAGQQFWWL
jgi:hypothetical protein